MREVTYTDRDGRRWKRLLPDGEPDEAAHIGIPAGPPPLDRLNLPHNIAVALHNELHDRGLFTYRDLRGRQEELRGALMASLRVDTQLLLECYQLAAVDAG